MAETEDDTTHCPVCFEAYGENGDQIPRLLPCSHTLRDRCMRRLLEGNVLTCPEDRMTNLAQNGTFPQNKYIITRIRKERAKKNLETRLQKRPAETDLCPKHKREKSLYCTEESCKKPICLLCLKFDHKNHDFEELKLVTERERLIFTLNHASENLQRNRAKFEAAKLEINQKFDTCAVEIKIQRDTQVELIVRMINERYDKLAAEISDQKSSVTESIDKAVATIDEHLAVIKIFRENTNETTTLEDVTDRMETFTDIMPQIDKELSGKMCYSHFQYTKGKVSTDDVEKMCGHLKLEEISIRLAALDFECTVRRLISTNFEQITDMIEGTDCVMVCGYKDGQRQLTKYSLRHGGELNCTQLEDSFACVTQVTLAGELCVALAFRDGNKIEFHRVNDLNQIPHIYSVAPHKPGTVCTSSPTTLLYVDESASPREIRQLDCSKSSPVTDTDVTRTQRNLIYDMCHVQHEGNELIITTHGTNGVHAYVPGTDRLAWKATGLLPKMEKDINARGVTTDGQGHLFVCDGANLCVQMFFTNGMYFGEVYKVQGRGRPDLIRWCKSASCLAVTYESCDICIIQVQ